MRSAFLQSSAPRIHQPADYSGPLADWGRQANVSAGDAKSDGQLLFKSPDGLTESGLWQCSPGEWPLELPRDELCHFVSGRATYVSDAGQRIEVRAGSVVLFPKDWKGRCIVHETMRNVYMLNRRSAAPASLMAAILEDPATYPGPFKDWGEVPTMIEGHSHTSGTVLFKGAAGESESGIWICTPGYWNCHVTGDEFCHFLLGRCSYTHESGEVIEIVPDTVAFFPKGWRGTCRIHETIRKVYMIS